MSGLKWVDVPDGYHCPFCPDHDDEDFFVWDLILDQPICHGCSYDLYFALLEAGEENPIGTDLLNRLEELTGKPFVESALSLLRNEKAYLEEEENLQAEIADPRKIPAPRGEEITIGWQAKIDQFRSILAKLTELARKKE